MPTQLKNQDIKTVMQSIQDSSENPQKISKEMKKIKTKKSLVEFLNKNIKKLKTKFSKLSNKEKKILQELEKESMSEKNIEKNINIKEVIPREKESKSKVLKIGNQTYKNYNDFLKRGIDIVKEANKSITNYIIEQGNFISEQIHTRISKKFPNLSQNEIEKVYQYLLYKKNFNIAEATAAMGSIQKGLKICLENINKIKSGKKEEKEDFNELINNKNFREDILDIKNIKKLDKYPRKNKKRRTSTADTRTLLLFTTIDSAKHILNQNTKEFNDYKVEKGVLLEKIKNYLEKEADKNKELQKLFWKNGEKPTGTKKSNIKIGTHKNSKQMESKTNNKVENIKKQLESLNFNPQKKAPIKSSNPQKLKNTAKGKSVFSKITSKFKTKKAK